MFLTVYIYLQRWSKKDTNFMKDLLVRCRIRILFYNHFIKATNIFRSVKNMGKTKTLLRREKNKRTGMKNITVNIAFKHHESRSKYAIFKFTNG